MYPTKRTLRFIAGTAFAALVATAAGMTVATAQQSQTQQSQTLSVKDFVANPGQLLKLNPNGGPLLTNTVQQLVLADPNIFKTILDLLKDANDKQKGAIGEGLAQAAKIEVLTNQQLAQDWQAQILAITDPAFKTAAANAFGDVQLGAVGGGPLGGPLGGGGGGQTNPITQGGSSTSFQNLVSNPTPTANFTTSGSAGGGPGGPGSPVSQ